MMRAALLLAAVVAVVASEDNAPTGPVIGIDLGTTYSCVGIYKNGKVEIITNDQGNRITPSYVGWNDGDRVVGDAAKNQATLLPKQTVFSVKRLIGRQWADKEVQDQIKTLPYQVVEKDGKPVIEANEKQYTCEEISAMVLGNMKNIAEKFLGQPVKDAVVTVPAYFNDAQRQATKNAGTIAGLNVLRIFNEPTAAALAYGLENARSEEPGGELNILVFDLGGGTFDVTLLTIDQGVFEVLATSGDTNLGGEDFDQRIMAHFVKQIKKERRIDISKDARALQKLRKESERAKRELSSKSSAMLEVDAIINGDDFQDTLTRAKFEQLCADLFKKVVGPLEQVLKDAEMSKSEVNKILLVGGSTRIPKVREIVAKFFGKNKLDSTSVNPDEAVAFGAAVQAGILSGEDRAEAKDLLLLDVTPLSLGIETNNGLFDAIIKRNTAIPVRKTKEFTTQDDNQKALTNRVFEGERPLVKDNHKLGEFLLEGLTPAPRGQPRIEMQFELDANGILQVTASEQNGAAKKSITITGESGKLSEEDIERMMREAEENEQADKTAAERVAVLNELEALVYSLSPKEGENGEAAAEAPDYVKEALAWLVGSPSAEVEELREKIKELKEAAAADGGAQGGGEGGGADEPDESDDEEGDEL